MGIKIKARIEAQKIAEKDIKVFLSLVEILLASLFSPIVVE